MGINPYCNLGTELPWCQFEKLDWLPSLCISGLFFFGAYSLTHPPRRQVIALTTCFASWFDLGRRHIFTKCRCLSGIISNRKYRFNSRIVSFKFGLPIYFSSWYFWPVTPRWCPEDGSRSSGTALCEHLHSWWAVIMFLIISVGHHSLPTWDPHHLQIKTFSILKTLGDETLLTEVH